MLCKRGKPTHEFQITLSDCAYQPLVDVNEVDYGEDRQDHLETQNHRVLLDSHEVALLHDARENQRLQEYGAAHAAQS